MNLIPAYPLPLHHSPEWYAKVRGWYEEYKRKQMARAANRERVCICSFDEWLREAG